MHKVTLARRAALAGPLGVVLTLVACGTSSHTSPPEAAPGSSSGARVIRAEGYKIDSDPLSAMSFFDNQNVFTATVVSIAAPVHVIDQLPDGGQFEAVYSPVRVKIDSVYQGSLAAGSVVVVRAMGGEAGGLRYEAESAPDKNTFTPGARLVVFGGEYSAVDSESAPAMTPNFVYQQKGSDYVDATYGDGPTNGGPVSRIPAQQLKGELAMRAQRQR